MGFQQSLCVIPFDIEGMSVVTREPRTLSFDRYLLDRALSRWELTPLRITLLYVMFGVAALWVSDVYLVQRFSEPLLGQLQALKGGLEVLLTGGVIYVLTRAKEAQATRSHERVDRQREELLVLHRVLRHNLRNKLNIVIGVSESLSGRDRRLLRKTAEDMLHYTEQAARIRRVTAEEARPRQLDLAEVVHQAVEELPDGVDLTVDLPQSVGVRVNAMFREALAELLTNAVEHNDSPVPAVEVTVDPRVGPLHHVELRVADNGPGIPDSVVDVLASAEVSQLSHLQGLGLWFVYWVVVESDGHLLVEAADGGGSVVRIRVPAASIVSAERLEVADRARGLTG